jgi:hypothetical protein
MASIDECQYLTHSSVEYRVCTWNACLSDFVMYNLSSELEVSRKDLSRVLSHITAAKMFEAYQVNSSTVALVPRTSTVVAYL